MEFMTKVEIPPRQPAIRHSDKLMAWGSCFTENIGQKLLDYRFRCDINPFGVLYNPLSIAEGIREILGKKHYTADDLLSREGNWFSLMHHSSFNATDAETCLRRINGRLEKSREHLIQTDWLLFTWGTSRVYEWKENGKIVGNCHKLPERLFRRRLLETDEIVEEYRSLLENIRRQKPDIRVLFTVSPIRHTKDGMHGNQLNKAILLIAIDKLCGLFPFCHYFPAYEIMMDELRDYRFYAEDMIHPSPTAVDYIWERFSGTYFPEDTRVFMRQWEGIRKGLSHKPFNPESESYRTFLSQILLKIEQLKEKFPYLDVQNEEQICQALLKK
ncbi:MAG TPA: GSCFA domain-containing protein [Candidatus Phocaeicola excrementigallinarum]|nr:GSCFA domain-containing protein [Candidatus Phocaeicola excrementigallinarum]